MTTASAEPGRLFSFVPPDHPFAPALDDLRETVATRPHLLPAGSRGLVRAEVKGVRTADGWQLDRFSCCRQAWLPGPPSASRASTVFRASTLYWRRGHGPAQWSTLPSEPYLDGLAAVLGDGARRPADLEVLRYVPLRRFTWRADGQVHKAKRRSRLTDSYARVRAVVLAAEGSDVRVPALRGGTLTPAVYHQDVVAGAALSETAGPDDLLALLAEAGEVHAAFGALPVRNLPAGSPEACRPDVVRTTSWVAFLLPELADLLQRARTVLLASRPDWDQAVMATCHGDFVPSHLIGRPGCWSVIDLDLAHRGDRYRDLAMFLAGLPGDVPALGDGVASAAGLAAAEQAYLAGYTARWTGALDQVRLAWHRAAAELHVLSVMVSKDAVDPAAVARCCRVLDEVLGEMEARR